MFTQKIISVVNIRLASFLVEDHPLVPLVWLSSTENEAFWYLNLVFFVLRNLQRFTFNTFEAIATKRGNDTKSYKILKYLQITKNKFVDKSNHLLLLFYIQNSRFRFTTIAAQILNKLIRLERSSQEQSFNWKPI